MESLDLDLPTRLDVFSDDLRSKDAGSVRGSRQLKSWGCTHLRRAATVAVAAAAVALVAVATGAVAPVAVATGAVAPVVVATGAVAPVVGIPSYFERTLRPKQTRGVQRGSWFSYCDHFKDWFV